MTVKHPPFPFLGPDGDIIGAEDWLGNNFFIGDKVVYCISAGRGQMMAIGKVLKIELPELGYWQQQAVDAGREVWEELRIQVLTERSSGHWNNEARTRPAWVNSMNITALPVRA